MIEAQVRPVTVPLETTAPQWLCINMTAQDDAEAFRIPLHKQAPVEKSEVPDEWPMSILSVSFARNLHAQQLDQEDNNNSSTDLEPAFLRDGWLYIFYNGYLWREVRCLRRGYQDVDLNVILPNQKANARPQAQGGKPWSFHIN